MQLKSRLSTFHTLLSLKILREYKILVEISFFVLPFLVQDFKNNKLQLLRSNFFVGIL